MSILTYLRALICPPPCMDESVVRPFNVLHHVSGSHVREVLRVQYPNAHIRIADSEYSTISIDDFNTWLKNDCVSEKTYYAQHFDCDNFSREIRCNMFRANREYKTEFTMAYTEGMSPGGYHAFCIFLDSDDNVWIVEPQNDHVVLCEDSKYLPDFIQL